jgi:hypothetical protein
MGHNKQNTPHFTAPLSGFEKFFTNTIMRRKTLRFVVYTPIVQLNFRREVEAFASPLTMKTFQLRVTMPFALSGLMLCALSAQAQPVAPVPAPAAAPQTTPDGQRRARKGGVPPRVFRALQAKTGQATAPELRRRLQESARTRDAAVEAAQEKYLTEFAAATGVSLEEAREMHQPVRRGAGAAGANGAANPNGAGRNRGGRRAGAAEAPVAAPMTQ